MTDFFVCLFLIRFAAQKSLRPNIYHWVRLKFKIVTSSRMWQCDNRCDTVALSVNFRGLKCKRRRQGYTPSANCEFLKRAISTFWHIWMSLHRLDHGRCTGRSASYINSFLNPTRTTRTKTWMPFPLDSRFTFERNDVQMAPRCARRMQNMPC